MGEPINGKPASVALNRSEVRRLHLFDLERPWAMCRLGYARQCRGCPMR